MTKDQGRFGHILGIVSHDTITREEYDALDLKRPLTDGPIRLRTPRNEAVGDPPESLIDIYTGAA